MIRMMNYISYFPQEELHQVSINVRYPRTRIVYWDKALSARHCRGDSIHKGVDR